MRVSNLTISKIFVKIRYVVCVYEEILVASMSFVLLFTLKFVSLKCVLEKTRKYSKIDNSPFHLKNK